MYHPRGLNGLMPPSGILLKKIGNTTNSRMGNYNNAECGRSANTPWYTE